MRYAPSEDHLSSPQHVSGEERDERKTIFSPPASPLPQILFRRGRP